MQPVDGCFSAAPEDRGEEADEEDLVGNVNQLECSHFRSGTCSGAAPQHGSCHRANARSLDNSFVVSQAEDAPAR
jgi:hypothetical protein